MDNQKTATGSVGGVEVTLKQTIIDGIKVPYEGAVVILHLGDGDEVQNNYGREMPALITRVWNKNPPFTCNLKGLPDGPGTIWRTSVMHQQGLGSDTAIAQGASWRWPDEPLKRGTASMKADE